MEFQQCGQSPALHGILVFRELLLVSQQSRTEQLQEALRQKVRSEDSWRDKVTLGGSALGGFSFTKGTGRRGTISSGATRDGIMDSCTDWSGSDSAKNSIRNTQILFACDLWVCWGLKPRNLEGRVCFGEPPISKSTFNVCWSSWNHRIPDCFGLEGP